MGRYTLQDDNLVVGSWMLASFSYTPIHKFGLLSAWVLDFLVFCLAVSILRKQSFRCQGHQKMVREVSPNSSDFCCILCLSRSPVLAEFLTECQRSKSVLPVRTGSTTFQHRELDTSDFGIRRIRGDFGSHNVFVKACCFGEISERMSGVKTPTPRTSGK